MGWADMTTSPGGSPHNLGCLGLAKLGGARDLAPPAPSRKDGLRGPERSRPTGPAGDPDAFFGVHFRTREGVKGVRTANNTWPGAGAVALWRASNHMRRRETGSGGNKNARGPNREPSPKRGPGGPAAPHESIAKQSMAVSRVFPLRSGNCRWR